MQAAGVACAVGVDGWRLLTTADTVERLTLIALAIEAGKARIRLGGQAIWGGGE